MIQQSLDLILTDIIMTFTYQKYIMILSLFINSVLFTFVASLSVLSDNCPKRIQKLVHEASNEGRLASEHSRNTR